MNDLPFYLCLAGPTASGKSAAALAIAQELNCEIVSVDSALVYRGMDIGTAKPTLTERAQVAHHLIDIRDPLQPYSAADFVRDARAHILAIHARGKRTLLVGGTMLYFKALFDGLDAMPSANPELRAQLEQDAALLATLRERGIAATRQLAKRQLTWLRSMPQRLVVACDQPGALDKVLELVRSVVGAEMTG